MRSAQFSIDQGNFRASLRGIGFGRANIAFSGIKNKLGAPWRFLKAWAISMGCQFGNLARWVLAVAALACASVSAATSALAGGDDLDLVCTGNSYQKDGPFPTVETFSVKIAGTKPVMIGQPGSDKPVKARIVANNAMQLKFATGKFTGEYFHFTGDLFLIHTDGRLTRLTCKPSAGPLGAAVGGVVDGVTGGVTGLLGTDQRQRFREYAMREHRPSPSSFREPVTVGTVLPLAGIRLYEIPREFGIPPEYRYAVVNNHVFLVDPVTHQIVDIVD
jgi:Protein of unknown function (DUF1236)